MRPKHSLPPLVGAPSSSALMWGAGISTLGGGLFQGERDFPPRDPGRVASASDPSVGTFVRSAESPAQGLGCQGLFCSPALASIPSGPAHRAGLLTQFPCQAEPYLSGFPPAPRYHLWVTWCWAAICPSLPAPSPPS